MDLGDCHKHGQLGVDNESRHGRNRLFAAGPSLYPILVPGRPDRGAGAETRSACSDASVKPLDSLGLCTRWPGSCFAWCLHSLYPVGLLPALVCIRREAGHPGQAYHRRRLISCRAASDRG